VVRRQRDAVREQEGGDRERDARATPRDDDADGREREQQPVDDLQRDKRRAAGLVPVVVRRPEEVVAIEVLPDHLRRLAAQPLAVQRAGPRPQVDVGATQVPRMRVRISPQLGRGGRGAA